MAFFIQKPPELTLELIQEVFKNVLPLTFLETVDALQARSITWLEG